MRHNLHQQHLTCHHARGQVQQVDQEGIAGLVWVLFPPELVVADSAYIVVMTGMPWGCALQPQGTVTSVRLMAILSLCAGPLMAHLRSTEWMITLTRGCLTTVFNFCLISMHRAILAIDHAVGMSVSPGTRAGTPA